DFHVTGVQTCALPIFVSDVAGSSSTVGKSGGTGIPGPMLALAKELSVLPIFKNINVGENSLSVFLSKLFNGTLLAKHDDNGKIRSEERRVGKEWRSRW